MFRLKAYRGLPHEWECKEKSQIKPEPCSPLRRPLFAPHVLQVCFIGIVNWSKIRARFLKAAPKTCPLSAHACELLKGRVAPKLHVQRGNGCTYTGHGDGHICEQGTAQCLFFGTLTWTSALPNVEAVFASERWALHTQSLKYLGGRTSTNLQDKLLNYRVFKQQQQ